MRKRLAATGLILYLVWESYGILHWGRMMIASGDAAPLGLLVTYQRQFVAILLALIALLMLAIKKRVNPVLGIITFIVLPLYMSYSLLVSMLNDYAMVGDGLRIGVTDLLVFAKYLLLFLGIPLILASIKRDAG